MRSAVGRLAMAAIGLGTALALAPVGTASACSCEPTDPATIVTLEIVGSAVTDADNPFGGDGGSGGTIDLRGESTTVVGALPSELDGIAIEDVPVLASILTDPDMQDSCGTPHRPARGSDVEVRGIVVTESGPPFVYTGPRSGTFTVTAAPPQAPDPILPNDSRLPVAVIAMTLIAVCVAVKAMRPPAG